MNCEQIREAIDHGSVHESMDRHLTACAACQAYEAETASLLSLLSAQPRVKAPANFEAQLQARLQATLASEDAKLSALLGALPAVAAPANFEAQLQARLATEEVKLATLVGAMPVVNAPADFDFRLRGRMAQANASAVSGKSGLFGWLEQFQFSFAQAGAAMAAVALVVAFSVTQFNRHDGQSPAAQSDRMAMVKVDQPAAQVVNTPAADMAVKQATTFTPVKVMSRSTGRVAPAVNRSTNAALAAEPAVLVASNAPASLATEQAVLTGTTRQELRVSRSGYAFGKQMEAAAPKAETAILTF